MKAENISVKGICGDDISRFQGTLRDLFNDIYISGIRAGSAHPDYDLEDSIYINIEFDYLLIKK